jgi:hypothetical protein
MNFWPSHHPKLPNLPRIKVIGKTLKPPKSKELWQRGF